MSVDDTNSRNMIMTAMDSGMMTYTKYDLDERMLWIIEAPESAREGAPALLTEYKYNGLSHQIVATKETVVPWQVIYDFDDIDVNNLP